MISTHVGAHACTQAYADIYMHTNMPIQCLHTRYPPWTPAMLDKLKWNRKFEQAAGDSITAALQVQHLAARNLVSTIGAR